MTRVVGPAARTPADDVRGGLAALFAPRGIAVVGTSRNPATLGARGAPAYADPTGMAAGVAALLADATRAHPRPDSRAPTPRLAG